MIEKPLKYPGGKYYMVEHIHRIARLAGEYTHRVIPCAGGMAELWNWEHEGISEIVNDTSFAITNFYRVLQDPECFDHFKRLVETIPFSRIEFDHYKKIVPFGTQTFTDIDAAVALFVQIRMSRSGDRKGFAPPSRLRTRRGMNEQVSSWLSAIEGLPEAHMRLRRIFIECLDCLDLMRREDKGRKVLLFIDPPYHHDSRVSKKLYEEEWDTAKHEQFLGCCVERDCNVMICGYPTELYDSVLHDWKREVFEVPNSMGDGDTKRIMQEVIYYNFG